MDPHLLLLAATAASVGFIHTLMGPDHYVPFIVLARARGWSLARTLAITLACGVGHVASSVVLGLVGIAAGVGVARLESAEAARGDLAGWLLITVGLVYATWGLHRALRHAGHSHYHFPRPDELGPHDPLRGGGEAAAAPASSFQLTPWTLFVVFALGPCEPLIPVLMYPAATVGWWGVAFVAAVFAVATLAAMSVVVAIAVAGLHHLPLGGLERYSHALAGASILIAGLGVQLLGW